MLMIETMCWRWSFEGRPGATADRQRQSIKRAGRQGDHVYVAVLDGGGSERVVESEFNSDGSRVW